MKSPWQVSLYISTTKRWRPRWRQITRNIELFCTHFLPCIPFITSFVKLSYSIFLQLSVGIYIDIKMKVNCFSTIYLFMVCKCPKTYSRIKPSRVIFIKFGQHEVSMVKQRISWNYCIDCKTSVHSGKIQRWKRRSEDTVTRTLSTWASGTHLSIPSLHCGEVFRKNGME